MKKFLINLFRFYTIEKINILDIIYDFKTETEWNNKHKDLIFDLKVNGYNPKKSKIIINDDNKLIDGRHRYEILLELYGSNQELEVKKINSKNYFIKIANIVIVYFIMMPYLSIETIIQELIPEKKVNLKKASEEIREILEEKRKEMELSFIEDTHTYFMKDSDGEIKNKFPSVSKVLKKFYPEFPTDEAAEKKSKGDPVIKQQLIEEWAAAGDYSTNMGSRVHYLLEKKLIEKYGNYKEIRQPIFDCDFTQILKGDSMVSAGSKYLKLMETRNVELLDTEIVLGHPDLGYTGQPDKVWLVRNKKGTEFGLLITDWKTNKPKNFVANNFTKQMFEPFSNLPNTALGHYQVQLPLYGKLLLKMLEGTKYENIRLYGCIVVLLREDSEYEEYRVPQDVIDTVLNMNVKDYIN